MTKNKIINDGKEVINTEIQGIKKLNKIIDKNFDKAVRALAKVKGRVIITGVGKSGHIASKISSTMSSTGTPSQYCSPCLLYTSPSPRDRVLSRMPSSA